MSTAQDALALARRYGVGVELRGDRLRLHAPSEPPPAVLTALREHKSEIVAVLTGPAVESTCLTCGGRADDTNSNTVAGDEVLCRVHHLPHCYDRWFKRAFGRKPQPANLN